MRSKLILFLLLLLMLSACVLSSSYLEGDDDDSYPLETAFPTATQIPMVTVVIAIQDIPLGTVIGPDRVAVIFFPLESAPASAYTSLEYVVGKYAISNIYREELILAPKISDNPEFADFGNAILMVVASRDLTEGSVLSESDLAITFYVRNSIELFEANGYELDEHFSERSIVVGRSLSRDVRQFEPITAASLSGG